MINNNLRFYIFSENSSHISHITAIRQAPQVSSNHWVLRKMLRTQKWVCCLIVQALRDVGYVRSVVEPNGAFFFGLVHNFIVDQLLDEYTVWFGLLRDRAQKGCCQVVPNLKAVHLLDEYGNWLGLLRVWTWLGCCRFETGIAVCSFLDKQMRSGVEKTWKRAIIWLVYTLEKFCLKLNCKYWKAL